MNDERISFRAKVALRSKSNFELCTNLWKAYWIKVLVAPTTIPIQQQELAVNGQKSREADVEGVALPKSIEKLAVWLNLELRSSRIMLHAWCEWKSSHWKSVTICWSFFDGIIIWNERLSQSCSAILTYITSVINAFLYNKKQVFDRSTVLNLV